jgi:O-antigen biosynthesis protein
MRAVVPVAPIRLPQSDQPQVSIVVLLRADARLAARVLQAIAAAHDHSTDAEVIVVVNTTDRATRTLVSENVIGARAIVRDVNTGTAVGWNLGFEAARGPYVALLHEDSVPEASWLEPLVAALLEHPRAAAAGSRLLHPDGTLQGGGIIAWRDGNVTWLTAQNAPETLAGDVPYPIFHVSSAAMLVDRAVWTAVGGFDERYFPAFRVEVDLGLALWSHGHTVLSVPRSLVRHDLHSTLRGAPSPFRTMTFRRYLQERNRQKFLAKWGAALSFLPAPPEMDSSKFPEVVEPVLQRLRVRSIEPVSPAVGAPTAARPFTEPGAEGLDRRLEDAHAEVRDGFLAWLVSTLEQTTADLDRERQMQARERSYAKAVPEMDPRPGS